MYMLLSIEEDKH